MDSLIRRRAAAIAAALVAAGISAPTAVAQPGHTQRATAAQSGAQTPTRLVTYAARVCDRYTDITANRARNNIQESLKDLGADSLYAAGQAVTAQKEQAGQPNCRPLPNWRFTLGKAAETRAVLGPWGALARVLDPYDTPIVTQTAVPLLDADGHDTGGSLAGAVTVALTREQALRAATSSSLWVQGGTPTDPVLDELYPGEYGFGALRCAVDNLNGDNVEWIAYPEGASHVFCFAYYVKPPPTSGTIIVRKVVDDPSVTSKQAFTFSGNISFTVDRRFTLSAAHGSPDAVTFFRGEVPPGGTPWSLREELPEGWSLTGLDCQSADGTSAVTTDLASGEASVALAGGDTVTCTYTNALTPPPATLQLSKRTIGGVGSFDYTVSGPDRASQTIATTAQDVWTDGSPLSLTAGRYQIAEEAPDAGAAGRWERTQVTCDGVEHAEDPVDITLAPGGGAACAFTNTFIPGGGIVIFKKTIGNTARVGYVIERVGDPKVEYRQVADVRRTNVPTRAKGDDTSHIPLGTYRITELEIGPPTAGAWRLESVVCNGRPVSAAQGVSQVELTADQPRLRCTYTNRYGRHLPPENPPPPQTTPETSTEVSESQLEDAAGPFADLAITKQVTPGTVRVGQLVRYRVVVVNNGPDPARDVTVVDIASPPAVPVRVSTTKGTCDPTRREPCVVGTLQPGERAEITAVVRARRVGRVVDRVATVSSTTDPDRSNNRAQARLTVGAPAPQPGSGSQPAYTG